MICDGINERGIEHVYLLLEIKITLVREESV
jgi:hypothetical protein